MLRRIDLQSLSPEARAIVSRLEVGQVMAAESQQMAFATSVGTPDDLSEEESDALDLAAYVADHDH